MECKRWCGSIVKVHTLLRKPGIVDPCFSLGKTDGIKR